jgi:catechol 2,3-dioxygenase-like lactoylglutathione lyase family enzyme
VFPSADTAFTQILVVRDPARSRSWYTDVLGATLYREYGTSVVLSFAGAWLLLVKGGRPTDDKPTVRLAPPSNRGISAA